MARQSDIRIRRSAVAGAVPGGADLNLGELALNTADGAVYVKNGAGNIVTASHDGILHYDEPNSRIGIGTTNPTYKFHVAGGGASYLAGGIQLNSTDKITIGNPNQFITAANDTSLTLATDGSASLTILDNGNVGIGTTTPTNPIELSVAMASSTSDIFVTQTGTNTVGGGGGIKFSTSSSGGTNTNYWSGMTGTRSSSDDGSGELRFFTTKNGVSSNAAAEKMIITQDGYVGIGTSNPAAGLEVAGAGGITIRTSLTNSETGYIRSNSRGGGTNDADLRFGNTNSGDILTMHNKYVGIGTTGPGEKLHLAGDNVNLKLEGTGAGGTPITSISMIRGSVVWGIHSGVGGANLFGIKDATATPYRLKIDSTGSITFNEAYSFPTAIGVAGQVLKVPTSGTDLVWAADDGGSTALAISDADGDTKIQVEEGSDDDTIRFDVAGTELMTMTAAGITVDGGTGVVTTGGTFIVRQKGDTLSDGIGLTSSNGISHRIWKNGSGVLNIGSSSNSNAFQQDLTGNITIEGNITVTGNGVFSGAVTSGSSITIDSSGPYAAGSIYSDGNWGMIFRAKQASPTPADFLWADAGDTHLLKLDNTGDLQVLTGGYKIGTTTVIDASRNISIVNATSTGVVKHADGSTSAPSITFTDDLDKGIYSSSDGVNIATGGARRAYFNSAGITSGNNVYTSSTGEFRNYGGVWEATAGLTGNGFNFINSVDGTAATISSTGNAVFSGTLSSGNITTTGYLRGPSTFTIDPAGHGDNTGTVVIAGNLQIDGTTTSINSTTLDVDDINITVAKGAANAAAANGAGLTVDGANATLTYTSAHDEWNFNKNLVVGGKETTASFPLMVKSNTDHKGLHIEENSGAESWQMGVNVTGDLNFYNSGSVTPSITFEDSGYVGIGTASPAAKLDIKGSFEGTYAIKFTNTMGTGKIGGFRSHGTNGEDLTIYQDGARKQSWQSGFTTFFGTSNAEIMRIKNDGKVGIGTASPTEKLHVVGDVSIGTGGTGGTGGTVCQR